jgi:hypothetical protein
MCGNKQALAAQTLPLIQQQFQPEKTIYFGGLGLYLSISRLAKRRTKNYEADFGRDRQSKVTRDR